MFSFNEPTLRNSVATTSLTEATSWSSNDSSSSLESLDEIEKGQAIVTPTLKNEDTQPKEETWLEKYFMSKMNTDQPLPKQIDSTKWLKYLMGFVLFNIVMILVTCELSFRTMLKLGVNKYIDMAAHKMFTDPLFIGLFVISIGIGLINAIITDGITFTMLLHGRRRRNLPEDPSKRLIHAVVVTQYKEPLEVLDATVASLAESTLASSTICVLGSEARDPNANKVFKILSDRYRHCFYDFIMTSHQLVPGEIAGCSSNENFAARKVYQYAQEHQIDPFKIMLTICDADSLFDPVYLEHVEAEFWRTKGGNRAIYNAPINTYRNLKECDLLVQACEITRCQDELFNGLSFRPAQSNYSLTLGFAHEIDFWDPSNTSEDLHTTLKAMATTGQTTTCMVKIWSLILNDSVASFSDRWTQAKRHMWGIEECAWVLESFHHLRLLRWLNLVQLTFGRMLIGPNVLPSWMILLCPSVREFLFQLDIQTIHIFLGMFVIGKVLGWIQMVYRELFIHYVILAPRKHTTRPTLQYFGLLAIYPIMEQVAIFIFFTSATWAMLWRALYATSIVYVVAPKALDGGSSSSSSGKHELPTSIKHDATDSSSSAWNTLSFVTSKLYAGRPQKKST